MFGNEAAGDDVGEIYEKYFQLKQSELTRACMYNEEMEVYFINFFDDLYECMFISD